MSQIFQEPYRASETGVAPLAGTTPIAGTGTPAFGAGAVSMVVDAVVTPWYTPPAAAPASANARGGGVMGLFTSLIDGLNGYIRSLGAAFTESVAEGAPTQTVQNATFSSLGDPHLAESGTYLDAAGDERTATTRVDDMSAHGDLLSSPDFSGGYRVATTVTAPNANGVTYNQTATVFTANGQDGVTMNAGGGFAIVAGGASVALAAGQSTTLAAGETVTAGTDGSLTVAETNANGGSIATTLRSNGGGVDVTTVVADAAVGGDIAADADA